MKFGVVGLGNHAINRVMPVIADSGNQITAIYSRNIDKARKEGLKYQSRGFDNLESFLENGDFEAVYIASPNFLHYSQAKAALLSGRHVLLEKQMTLNTEESQELVELAAGRSLALAIGFHMRFHPAVDDLKRIIQSGELGDIAYISGMWASLSTRSYDDPDHKWWREDEKVGGGSVMGTGVHVIDTMNYILGRLPDRITAFREPKGEVIETTEHVTMQYGHTMVDAISSRDFKYPMNNLTIYGSGGTVVLTNLFSTSVEASLIRDGKKVKDYRGVNPYREEIRAFAKLAEGKESTIATGIDGLEVVRIVNLAYESDLRNKSFGL